MALAQKHFQFLRKGGFATLAAAKTGLINQMKVSVYAGEPIIAYYGAEGEAQHVLLGIGDKTSGSSIFYNAETTDALLAQLHTTISGSTDDQIASGITLNALKNAIEAAKKEDHLSSSSDVLVVTTDSNGTAISIRYDSNKTIKSSGSGVTFANNASVAANSLYVTDAYIEKGFKVLGGTVGQLTSGTQIQSGTTIIELLKQMLVKVADCTPVQPYSTLSASQTGTFEVGQKITQVLTATFQDGEFTGSTADYGYEYHQAAECAEGTVTFKQGTEEAQTGTSKTYTATDYVVKDGDNKWSVSEAYGASTKTPIKNNDSESTQSIAAGNTTTQEVSVTGSYKYFYGYTASVANENYSSVFTTKDSLSTLTDKWVSTTSIGTMTSSDAKSALVIVLPAAYKVKTTSNSLGATINVNDNWKYQNDITYNVDGTSHTYKVYALHAQGAITYKNITIGK